jgi:hypothetical protein
VTVAPSAAASTIRGIDPDWHTPYMQHWSLEVQHQFNRQTVVSAGYFGSKGTHLVGVVEINEVPPGVALHSMCATGSNTIATPGVTLVPCQTPGMAFLSSGATTILDQLRPYRGYRSITMLEPRFNSNYHSLQISAQRRFSGDSQVQVAYTWSKNLTDSQNDRSNAPQNTFDIRSEYSRAALDRRHVFPANHVYELPFFRGQHDLAANILGGWEASGIVTFQTGLPFTITTSNFDAAGLGNNPALIAGNRPNLLCNPNENAPHTLQQWFNTACFQRNPGAADLVANIPGTAGRGIVDGPKTHRVDFSLFKNIRFSESTRLQLRGEAFNVFNWTNFRTIGTNVTAANYGQVTAVRDPRTIQLGVKFIF